MKHARRAILFLCLLALSLLPVLSGCRGEPEAPAAPAESDPPPVETPQPAPVEPGVPVWEEKAYREAFTSPDGALVMTVSYTFPQLEESHPAAAVINQRYQDEAGALLATAAETAAFCTGDYETAIQVGYDFMPFLEDHSFTVTRQTADYASIRRELYANYGGAHPSVFLFTERFSLEDGHTLAFADFFPDQEAAAEQILAVIAGDPAIAENDLAAAAQAEFSAERFYVTDEGFTFWYPAGTFGAQNSPLEIAVPYEEVADWAALW